MGKEITSPEQLVREVRIMREFLTVLGKLFEVSDATHFRTLVDSAFEDVIEQLKE